MMLATIGNRLSNTSYMLVP